MMTIMQLGDTALLTSNYWQRIQDSLSLQHDPMMNVPLQSAGDTHSGFIPPQNHQHHRGRSAHQHPSPARGFLSRRHRSPSPVMTNKTNFATPTRRHRRMNSSGSQTNSSNSADKLVASVYSYEDVSTIVEQSTPTITNKRSSGIRSMSPARMLSRLNKSSSRHGGGGAATPSRKSKEGVQNSNYSNNIETEVQPLVITHTVSKPSPSRSKHPLLRQTMQSAASPARKNTKDQTAVQVPASDYFGWKNSSGGRRKKSSAAVQDALGGPSYPNNNVAGSRNDSFSGGRYYNCGTTGGTNDYLHSPSMTHSSPNTSHHHRTPSTGSIPTSYITAAPPPRKSHVRVSSAGNIPPLYYDNNVPISPIVSYGQYEDHNVVGGTPQRYHQLKLQQQHPQPQQYPIPPSQPQFEFATPLTTAPELPKDFFSSNSVYGDSTTMGGSSIAGSSLNGEDHMGDLLGVLNDEERDRYGDVLGGVYQDGGAATVKNGGKKEDGLHYTASPRRTKEQQPAQQQEEREVRVSVVTPQDKQQQSSKHVDTNESPTSIFSVFNCADITNDITETLNLIFSPMSKPRELRVNDNDVRRRINEDDDEEESGDEPINDDEEEERKLMKKLQKLREKKWKGKSGNWSSVRS